MNWDLVLKILGSFVAVLGTIYQLRQFNPVRRTRLKHDAEILEKLDKESKGYKILSKHIDEKIHEIYVEKNEGIKIYHPRELIMGSFFVIGFTILSVYIYNKNQGFSWWLILTGFIALSGAVGITNGFDRNYSEKKEGEKTDGDTDS